MTVLMSLMKQTVTVRIASKTSHSSSWDGQFVVINLDLAYTTSKGSTAIFIGVVIVGLVVSIVIPVVICISIICCAFCCAGVTSTSSSRRQSIPTNIIVPVAGYSSADKLNDPPPPYDSTTPSKQVYHQVDKRHDWQPADPSSIEDNLQPTTPQPRKESLSHPTRSDPLQPPTEPDMQAPNDVQPPIESSPQPPIGFKPLLPPSQYGGYPYQTGLAISPGNFPPQSVPISALSSGPLPISYPSPIGSPRLSPLPQAVSPTQPTGMPYQPQYSGASPPQEKYN